MKVGIYNSCHEPKESANSSATVLAQALSHKFEVELVTNKAFKIVTDPSLPAYRYEKLRQWSEELTSRFDLFVNFCDRLPICSSAPNSVLMIQTPHDFVPSIYRTLWLEHLKSYQLKLANSFYTRFWTKALWDIECEVVYPPVPFQPQAAAKEDLIVISGSLRPEYRQLELLAAFRRLKELKPEWSTVVMGDLDERRSHQKYFNTLKGDLGVSIITNPSADQKQEMFARAKLLWYAAGLGTDRALQLQRVDTFSLDVVRAMAAGCVPLAINSGSLPEIIRYRETGIFWDSIDELIDETLKLIEDETQRQSLSNAAQERARAFNSELFTRSFMQQLDQGLGIRSFSRLSPAWLWKRLVRSADQFLVARR
jgi:glycosyltransferase involved in cell wall biosynthesis